MEQIFDIVKQITGVMIVFSVLLHIFPVPRIVGISSLWKGSSFYCWSRHHYFDNGNKKISWRTVSENIRSSGKRERSKRR